MKNLNPSNAFLRNSFLFALLALLFLGHCSFPRAVKLVQKNEIDKAEKLFQKAVDHKTYGTGARFYLGRMQINKDPRILPWITIENDFCALEKEVNLLSIKKILKLNKYDAGRTNIAQSRKNLQNRIAGRMAVAGTLTELKELAEHADCWSEGAVDSLRTIVVNKSINPLQEVYANETDKKWKGTPVQSLSLDQISQERGRSCIAISEERPWSITYEDAMIIANRFADDILPANYGSFWSIRQDIWDIFQLHHSYCEMDRFKADHPIARIANDCWFDDAGDTLCLSNLKPLLAFHRNNPHTALDLSICIQILCLRETELNALELNDEERRQVEDVQMMLSLQAQLLECKPAFDSMDLISKVAYLAGKYKHHKVVFDLATSVLDYFANNSRYDLARNALKTFQPLFPDSSVCAVEFNFQTGKQEWFDGFRIMLDRAEKEEVLPVPVSAWNTPDNDEYALVSWGETDEVFFVRRNNESGEVRVMTSRLKNERWTKPVPVKKLSISNDVVPLSISSNGRQMLLRSGGNLHFVSRPEVGRQWLTPEIMPVVNRFAGNAWLSPNDSLLLMEYYSRPPSAIDSPKTDIAVAKLLPNGLYGGAVLLDEHINLPDASEGNPFMALGGRLFLFTSDRPGGLGSKDMYSVNLSIPWDWSTAGNPVNLGLPVNTIYADNGLTYFSEYTGDAYFHRSDRCAGSMDIYRVSPGAEVFPDNAMRLAGLVMDEHGTPIGGGFMEFTPNYQLSVHAQSISPNGTYSYTVADSTEVVRLFPEIPGYYSERDTTHFLAKVAKGEIIRDTFRLTSFDYIRRNYKLVHSTFYNGIAQFDNPDKAYPELTRLAKIATRMGAELELTGHTDGTGTEANNDHLSKDRAQSVKLFLVEKCGFDPDRIKVFGFGSSRPICDNNTEEGRRCNRRVEIVFRMPELPE